MALPPKYNAPRPTTADTTNTPAPNPSPKELVAPFDCRVATILPDATAPPFAAAAVLIMPAAVLPAVIPAAVNPAA